MDTASSRWSSDTSSDGARRTVVGRTALTTSPSASAADDHRLRVEPGHQLGSEQEPGAANARHLGKGLQRDREPLPGAAGAARRVLALHDAQDRPRGGRCQGLTAEGAAVVAGGHDRRDVAAGPAGADRYPVAERLGHRHHVGDDTVVLESEPTAGPTETGLHLVDHEQGAPLVAEAPDALEVPGAGRVDAAFALHRLEQHGGHAGVERRVEGVEVVPGDVAKALGQRLEGLVLVRLAGGVEGGERAPVERAVGADHDMATAAAPPPGQLDGCLVGLGARVAHEDLPTPAEQPVERRPPPLRRARWRTGSTCAAGSTPVARAPRPPRDGSGPATTTARPPRKSR